MRSGKCPKCGSHALLEEKGGLSDTNSIRVSGSMMGRFPVERLICTDCGYTETWISSEDLSCLKREKQKQDNRSPFWK